MFIIIKINIILSYEEHIIKQIAITRLNIFHIVMETQINNNNYIYRYIIL